MRQFTPSDTSAWTYRYGTGASGLHALTSSRTIDATDGANYRGFTGTGGASTGSLGSALLFVGGCVIVDMTSGAWELNFLSNASSSSTATLALPLQNTYTNAQLITFNFYAAHDGAGFGMSAPALAGGLGGIGVLCCSSIIKGFFSARGGDGGVSTSVGVSTGGAGYEGGAGIAGASNPTLAFAGSGYSSLTHPQQTSTNGGTGGGAGRRTVNNYVGGGGGGSQSGGATGTQGTSGGTGGTGGGSIGSSDNTVVFLGGGGGGGAKDSGGSNSASSGGSGAGMWILISPQIFITAASTVNGGDSGSLGADLVGSGGGGGAGRFLFKAEHLDVGTGFVTAKGGRGTLGTGQGVGGNGGDGAITADVAGAVTGTASPAITVNQSGLFAEPSGAFLEYFL